MRARGPAPAPRKKSAGTVSSEYDGPCPRDPSERAAYGERCVKAPRSGSSEQSNKKRKAGSGGDHLPDCPKGKFTLADGSPCQRAP